MPDEKEFVDQIARERSAYLMGQVHALKQIIGAIASAWPDKAALLSEFEFTSLNGLAFLENELVSGQAIRGYQDIASDVMRVLKTA